MCQCRAGYESRDSGRRCVDVDECLVDDACSQLCFNTKGSYHCGYTFHSSCNTRVGFQLDD